MCKYCDLTSTDRKILIDPVENTWFIDVQTLEWDVYEKDYIYTKVSNIKFCPYCGEKLSEIK